MNIHKLELLKDANPEYHNLINESNEIMDEYGKIMGLIHSFKLPKRKIWKCELPKLSFFCGAKAELSIIGKEAITLTNRFLDWNNRALTFCASPHYSFRLGSEVDTQTSVIHYTNLLLYRANRLNNDITLLQNSYELRYSEIENAINYWIAITAWLLTFLGLGISIIGLIISLNR